ncbi:hypothetical protein ABBQ38_002500 [Trebouxia sp. C0009 RCD-2024]
MLYGSMLGLLGTAVLGSLAASYFGLSSLQDLKPASDSHDGVLQRWLQPYKERLQAYTRSSAAAQQSAEGSSTEVLPGGRVEAPLHQQPGSNSEFAQRLARRYNPHFSQPNTSPDQRVAGVF